jgi:hypothetical protein
VLKGLLSPYELSQAKASLRDAHRHAGPI